MALMTDEVDFDPSEWDDVPPWEVVPEPPELDTPPDDAPQPDLDLDDFLHQPEPEYDWVIPGLIERGDRIVLTGQEGHGKSTLLRQIAIQASAGIHPFTLEAIDPVRVLVIDLENSKRHVRRQFRPLRLVAEDLKPQQLRIRVVAQGVDLLHPIDEEFLERRIQANEPELLITGPIYKLASGDPTEEKVARHVTHILDRLRTKYGTAVFLEAHTPHAVGQSKRAERPYGASLWMRWPEFGLFLSEKGELRHWRGARDERAWPAQLQRGGEWPWSPVADARQLTFARMLDEVRLAGEQVSVRDLADRMGVDKGHIERAIKANRAQWEAFLKGFEEF